MSKVYKNQKSIAEAVLGMGGVVMIVPCEICDENPCICLCPDCVEAEADACNCCTVCWKNPCECPCVICEEVGYPDGSCHCGDPCFLCEGNSPDCGCCTLPFCGPEFGGKCRCTAEGFLPSY